MREETPNFRLLNKYHAEIDEINKSREHGRLSQTSYLSDPVVIQDVLLASQIDISTVIFSVSILKMSQTGLTKSIKFFILLNVKKLKKFIIE